MSDSNPRATGCSPSRWNSSGEPGVASMGGLARGSRVKHSTGRTAEEESMQDLRTRAGTMLNGTASGLVPMAVFTPFYAIWTMFAWPLPGVVIFGAVLAWSLYLGDRKSTRLNSSHVAISYAVFCLKKIKCNRLT